MDMSMIQSLIEHIPTDANDMMAQLQSTIDKHVSELYSPPRITKLCSQYGLKPGTAYDATVCDENGVPWNFDLPDQRNKAARRILTEKTCTFDWEPHVHSLFSSHGFESRKDGSSQVERHA